MEPEFAARADGAAGTVITTVFIAEDNQFARCGLRHIIKGRPGYKVIGESGNGPDALAQILELQPSLVITNLSLPGIDAVELTGAIKGKLPDTKVMVMSQLEDHNAVQAAFQAGALGFCLAGSPVERLLAALYAVSDGAGWIDPCISQTFLRTRLLPLAGQAPVADPDKQLSDREIEVLRLIAEGLSNSEIGQRLFVSAETIKTHIKHIMDKLEVNDRTLAVVTAIRRGIHI